MGGSLRAKAAAAVWVALLVEACVCYYLPGIAPVDYKKGERLDVYADRLASPMDRALPYDYYSLGFCEPPEGESHEKLNLGEILLGERDELTAYEFDMLKGSECKLLCERNLSAKEVKHFKNLIEREYYVRMNVDNMPLVMRNHDDVREFFTNGVPLGERTAEGTIVINNHITFEVEYHPHTFGATDLNVQDDNPGYRVVGFIGRPYSVGHKNVNNLACDAIDEGEKEMELTDDKGGQKVIFTYDVTFAKSDIEWATRWDQFLNADPQLKNIMWMSLINASAISVILAAVVATFLLRTVFRDFSRYNSLEEASDAGDDSGWKLLHGDVFRPPHFFPTLCILVGTGAQVFSVCAAVILVSFVGAFSPAHRGGLLTAMIVFFAGSSLIGGFVSSYLYRGFKGLQRGMITIGSALFLPSVAYGTFFALNIVLHIARSSSAASFWTLLLLLIISFGVSIPLAMLGSFLAYRLPVYTPPVRTNNVVRPQPPVVFKGAGALGTLFLGILPFGSIFVELVFIMNSMWQDDVFSMFGFLFLVFLILIITCAEVSVVATYLTLSGERHRWWWTSFMASSSSGLYVLAYSAIYVFRQPSLRGMETVSLCLYFAYMGLISLSFGLVTGFIGLVSSLGFVHKLFSSIRID